MWKRLLLLLMTVFMASPALQADELDEVYVRLFTAQLQQAKKGDAQGQLHVGEMYEKGLGTKPDLAQARKWYSKAASQGNKMAKEKLADWARVEKEFSSTNEDLAASIAKADRERARRAQLEAERAAREREAAARAERERAAKAQARTNSTNKPKAVSQPKPVAVKPAEKPKSETKAETKADNKGDSFSADPCKSPAAKFMSTCR